MENKMGKKIQMLRSLLQRVFRFRRYYCQLFLFLFFPLQIEQIYPDPVGVVSIGQKVVHLLSDPENKEWLSTSTELCGRTCTCKIMSVLK
jgi:hypothetical protein